MQYELIFIFLPILWLAFLLFYLNLLTFEVIFATIISNATNVSNFF